MADITLSYKGNTIAEINASGSKTLGTAGKYCEADIELVYVKPLGMEKYARQITFYNQDFTAMGIDEITVTSEYNVSGQYFYCREMFQGVKIKRVTVNAPCLTSMHYTFMYSTIEEATFNSGTGYVNGEFQSAFQSASNLKKVLGSPLDLYTSSNTNTFYYASALEEIRFVPSRITNNLNLAQCSKLSDASIISLANGLRSDVSGKTLKFHSDVSAKLPNMMGTVTDGIFTADVSGTVTLQDFITTTKGWTLT